MKYLIVGLGNIGAEYADTRHNIGFDVLDALAEASNTSFTTDRYGAVATLRSKGHTLVLLKPSTYMNLSGKAVRYWLDAEKIPRENLLVVVDDIALPFGTFRMRTKGSAGGHNGLKNITELLGTEEYSRIRFGIGGDFPRGHQVDYVLGHWNDEERKAMPERLKYFGDAILSFAAIGPERTMKSLQQEMTRRTETEKPQRRGCGFLFDEPDFRREKDKFNPRKSNRRVPDTSTGKRHKTTERGPSRHSPAPDSIRPRYFSGQWICVPASNGGRAAGSKSE